MSPVEVDTARCVPSVVALNAVLAAVVALAYASFLPYLLPLTAAYCVASVALLCCRGRPFDSDWRPKLYLTRAGRFSADPPLPVRKAWVLAAASAPLGVLLSAIQLLALALRVLFNVLLIRASLLVLRSLALPPWRKNVAAISSLSRDSLGVSLGANVETALRDVEAAFASITDTHHLAGTHECVAVDRWVAGWLFLGAAATLFLFSWTGLAPALLVAPARARAAHPVFGPLVLAELAGLATRAVAYAAQLGLLFVGATLYYALREGLQPSATCDAWDDGASALMFFSLLGVAFVAYVLVFAVPETPSQGRRDVWPYLGELVRSALLSVPVNAAVVFGVTPVVPQISHADYVDIAMCYDAPREGDTYFLDAAVLSVALTRGLGFMLFPVIGAIAAKLAEATSAPPLFASRDWLFDAPLPLRITLFVCNVASFAGTLWFVFDATQDALWLALLPLVPLALLKLVEAVALQLRRSRQPYGLPVIVTPVASSASGSFGLEPGAPRPSRGTPSHTPLVSLTSSIGADSLTPM